MSTSRLSFCALVLYLSLAMVACGGSGGSNNNPPPVNPTNDFVYTANAAGSPGTVSALTTNASTGALAAISGSPFNAGSAPRSMAVDSAGKFLFVGNYFSSDISVFGISSTSGALSAVTGSPFAAELGVDAVAVNPNATFLYAVSERSANVWAYSISSAGVLAPLVGYPESLLTPATAADSVIVDPSGKYVYTASRDSLHGYIHGFSINTSNGVGTANGSLTALPLFPLVALGSPAR
ncbi:MAG TPA: beta-propeller fold lactonase family protein, partial [Terriglobales bacterium]